MSLSEYEGHRNFWENDDEEPSSSLDDHGHLPADFDEEEIRFAQELEILFSPQTEELPPYFVQTLLESDDQRFRPAEDGLEQRVQAHVFRRLKLRRRLFKSQSFAFSPKPSIQRPLIAMCATFVIVLFMTVLFTAPSFAAGMTILLRGARSGVYQVHSFPPKLTNPVSNSIDQQYWDSEEPRQVTLTAAQQLLQFPIYWPEAPDKFSLTQIALCDNAAQQYWADGPVLEFTYEMERGHGVIPRGSGTLVISEFKPKGDVLQVVQNGAARAVKIDQNGQAEAIYVDGQWVYQNTHTWLFGQRSELIYQKNGVIFWIAADQRDGMDEPALLDVAHSLHLFNVSLALRLNGENYTLEHLNNLAEPFRTDILAVLNRDNSSLNIVSPVYTVPSSSQRGNVRENRYTVPTQAPAKSVTHSTNGS